MFNILELIFFRLLKASIKATIIGALIIVLKSIFKRKISTSKSNLLWILFVILLLFPLEIESKLSIQNYIPEFNKINYSFENFNYSFVEDDIEVKDDEFTITHFLLVGWFIITVLLFCVKNIFYLLSKNKYVSGEIASEELYDILNSCKKELNMKRNINLIMQDKIDTPAIIGIFKPAILVTKDSYKLSLQEIRSIFIHELTHYKRGDTFLYLLLNELCIIYWFNPFIYFEIKKLKQDLEFATDEETLKRIGKSNIKEYCKTILKMACQDKKLLEVPNISSSKKELERRIKMLKLYKDTGKGAIALLITLAIGISIATISLATNGEKDTEGIKKVDYEYSNEVENKSLEEVKLISPLKSDELKISNTFGERMHPITGEIISHNGIDIVAEKGKEVFSVADGIVLEANFDAEKGNYIIISHGGLISEYNHLSEIVIETNDEVKQGAVIGKVGTTGRSTGPHLHFGLKNIDGEYIDPLAVIE